MYPLVHLGHFIDVSSDHVLGWLVSRTGSTGKLYRNHRHGTGGLANANWCPLGASTLIASSSNVCIRWQCFPFNSIVRCCTHGQSVMVPPPSSFPFGVVANLICDCRLSCLLFNRRHPSLHFMFSLFIYTSTFDRYKPVAYLLFKAYHTTHLKTKLKCRKY